MRDTYLFIGGFRLLVWLSPPCCGECQCLLGLAQIFNQVSLSVGINEPGDILIMRPEKARLPPVQTIWYCLASSLAHLLSEPVTSTGVFHQIFCAHKTTRMNFQAPPTLTTINSSGFLPSTNTCMFFQYSSLPILKEAAYEYYYDPSSLVRFETHCPTRHSTAGTVQDPRHFAPLA